MAEENIKVPVQTLVDFTIEAATAMGISLEDARIIADVIITSDLWGVRSHGIAHLKMYHERIKNGLQLTTTNWQVVRESGFSFPQFGQRMTAMTTALRTGGPRQR